MAAMFTANLARIRSFQIPQFVGMALASESLVSLSYGEQVLRAAPLGFNSVARRTR